MKHRYSRTETNVRRFELWNACKPISWVNVGVSDGGVARGLASEVLKRRYATGYALPAFTAGMHGRYGRVFMWASLRWVGAGRFM